MLKKILWSFLIVALLLSACGPTATPPPTQPPQPLPSPTAAPQLPSPTALPTQLPYSTPDWFDQAVLYEIYVRSYADSNGDGIGDLAGITARLDYIQSLGVDVIWLMPIYPSPSVHGYDVTDFTAINPDFGTLADLQTLVKAVHQRDMYLILDYVPSHLSNQNPLFQQAYSNPDAENVDWFVFTNKTNTQYAGFGDSKTMPRFNHYNPAVVDYLIEAALFWLDLDGDGDYQDGIDGFRIDNATFPPREFFLALRAAIKQANPDALLLGETWVSDARSLNSFYADQFDALFDFPLYAIVQSNPNGINDGLLSGQGFPTLIKSLLTEQGERYPAEAQAVRFFSNHDTNRIATKVGGDPARQKLAASLLAALPGPIMLYYGEEIGMIGQKGTAPHWDSYRRAPMDWFSSEHGPDQTTWFMEPDRWNAPDDGVSVQEQDGEATSLLNYYRHVLTLRHSSAALQSSAIKFLEISADGQGALAFLRAGDQQQIIAVFNFGEETLMITLADFPFSTTGLVNLLTGESYPAATSGEGYTLRLPPAGAVWLSAP